MRGGRRCNHTEIPSILAHLAPTPLEQVKRYYDRNTRRFERFGHGKDTGAIHRAVYGEGVRSRGEALEYVDRLVLRELLTLAGRFAAPYSVLDLGCGVGASLLFLARHADIRGTGVTLSGVQAARASERIARAGASERVRCLQANFLELPPELGAAALAFSIEAFVHAPDPDGYFASAARHVAAGGLLVVCDDFLAESADRSRSAQSPRERRILDEVRSSWLAHTLVTAPAAAQRAGAAGFRLERNDDLTPLLELRRPRDRLIATAVALGRPLGIPGYAWRALVGGNALQQGLLGGLIEYRFLVFRRT
ncbi:MAG TPA: methyltransferase domain-containing protein [Polyangiaceae bacterium]